MQLRLLPNLSKHAIGWPHQTQPDGTIIQATTVKTVLRVGLAVAGNEVLPQPIQCIMSLQNSTGEIVAGPPSLFKKTRLFNALDGGSTTRELRPGKAAGDETDGGVARAECLAETTYDFRFGITPARNMVGGTKDSTVFLRFSLVGHPDVYVDTEPFRLLVKKDPTRVGPSMRLASISQGLSKAVDDLGESSAAAMSANAPDQQAISDCMRHVEFALQALKQHSAFGGDGSGLGALPPPPPVPAPVAAAAAAPMPPPAAAMAAAAAAAPDLSVDLLAMIESISEAEIESLSAESPVTAQLLRRANHDLHRLEGLAPQQQASKRQRAGADAGAGGDVYRACGDEAAAEASAPLPSPGKATLRLQGLLKGAMLQNQIATAAQSATQRHAGAKNKLAAIVREVLVRARGGGFSDGAAGSAALLQGVGEELDDFEQWIDFQSILDETSGRNESERND